jgi:hypothetical protein
MKSAVCLYALSCAIIAVGTVQNARVVVRSPTVIEVMWDPVSESSIRGAELMGYKLTYRAEGERENRLIILVPENIQHEITHLGWYPILA